MAYQSMRADFYSAWSSRPSPSCSSALSLVDHRCLSSRTHQPWTVTRWQARGLPSRSAIVLMRLGGGDGDEVSAGAFCDRSHREWSFRTLRRTVLPVKDMQDRLVCCPQNMIYVRPVLGTWKNSKIMAGRGRGLGAEVDLVVMTLQVTMLQRLCS